jgi:hypothetical protein
MKAWAAILAGGLLAIVFVASVFVSPVFAQCENTGKSCLQAMRFHQRVCARVGQSSPRDDCYKNGEKAYDECIKTGKWVTKECSLSNLPEK